MKRRRIKTAFSMILRMLMRRRVIIIALIIIPLVFLSIVQATAPTTLTPFRIASLDETVFIQEILRDIASVFFAVTSSGFLVSLIALNLVQVEHSVNRRLVLCGYTPSELLIANLLVLLLLTIVITSYISGLVAYFVEIEHFPAFILGLVLVGFVYGSYGLLVGSAIKGKLEGVFFIVLLANIDAGWLQNPMYYADANNSVIIRYLPAYFPSQTSIIAAFTDYVYARPVALSLLYGGAFLLLALLIFYIKMRIRK